MSFNPFRNRPRELANRQPMPLTPDRLFRIKNFNMMELSEEEDKNDGKPIHDPTGTQYISNCGKDCDCKDCELKNECSCKKGKEPEEPSKLKNYGVLMDFSYDPDKLKNRFTLPLDGFIHLVPLGDYPHPAGIVQVIDEEAVNSMAANFASRAAGDANFPGILLDFDHFSDNPDAESRAAAWIDDIQVRHDGLWGKPKWTGTGERAVTSGEYRLVSPTWNKSDCEELGDDRCRPMILDSVALTNNPNMKGMVPISK